MRDMVDALREMVDGSGSRQALDGGKGHGPERTRTRVRDDLKGREADEEPGFYLASGEEA